MLDLPDTLRCPPNPLVAQNRSAGMALFGQLGWPMVERRGRSAANAFEDDGGDAAQEAARQAEQTSARFAQALDLLDHGVLLLTSDGQVSHVNKAARRELARGHALQVVAGRLQTRRGADAAALREAVQVAALRGFRRLLALGQGGERCSVAVLPLQPAATQADHGVAVVFARRQLCDPLTVEWFARSHSLTMAETTVVKGLCDDLTPQQIAEQQGVGLATVRTQIGAIRMKTGACSIRALLHMLALLPPVASLLPDLASDAAPRQVLHA
jgi:DNA-binding CsgD family transcriptional regulator